MSGGAAQTASVPASVVSLADLSAELLLPTAYQAGEAGVAEIMRLTETRKVGMAQIGVPPPCLTLLAEAGVYAGNLADLPWTVLDSMVGEASGMGLVQVTLLRTLHERLQAGSVRGSRSGSRSSSRTGLGLARDQVMASKATCACACRSRWRLGCSSSRLKER